MRYFFKLFLSMIFILTAALSAIAYLTISDNMTNAYEREVQNGRAQHQMVKYSIQTAMLTDSDSVDFDSTLASIASGANKLCPRGGGLAFANSEGTIIFSSLPVQASEEPLGEVGMLYCNVLSDKEETVLCVRSMFELQGKTYKLYTQTSMTNTFQEFQKQQTSFSRIYLIILGIGTLFMLVLAWGLTRPITRLREASRRFAEGDYSARSGMKSRDEIGELAQVYDQMADTIQDKIEELEQAAQRQRDFTANFAHEMKTPMTSIIGYADALCQKRMNEEEVHRAAEFILNEGMRLEALSFKLLELLTLDHGEFILEEILISDVLKDAAQTAVPAANKKGIVLECKCDDAWVRVEFDLFKTLMMNLLDNAMKSGATRIILGGERDGETYWVYVRDNGRGIPEEDLGRITEAFYMVDKSRSRKQHGAGLGLALCAKIAEIHNSRLEYTSEVNAGTEVRLGLICEVDDEV